MIFRDKDIGVYEYWQTHIHEAHADEDCDTDDEQKVIAQKYCWNELKETFKYIKENGKKSFVNANRFHMLDKNIHAKKLMKNAIKRSTEFFN